MKISAIEIIKRCSVTAKPIVSHAAAMRLRELESILEDVKVFESPKLELEQYPTSPHIAARILHVMHGLGDLEGRAVVDLGCGCGILALGASLLGSGYTLGVDIDADALETARLNASILGIEGHLGTDFLVSNIHTMRGPQDDEALRKNARSFPWKFDVVVMNPPFGTRTRGADVEFLRTAASIVNYEGVVYSLHKASTRNHIAKVATRLGATSAEVLAQLRFDIPHMYRFHRKESQDVEVDLWRVQFRKAISSSRRAFRP